MAKGREMRVIKADESNFEKIVAHYMNPEEFPLTDKLEELRMRWSEILVLRIGGFTPGMIVRKWKKDKEIEQAQAYKDIRDSENLYGNMTKFSVQSRTALWTAWAEDYMLRMRQKGNDKKEGFALKLLRPDEKEESIEFNPEKLENVEIRFDIPKKALDALMGMAGKGVQDFNNYNVIDTEFEEVNDEPEN